jgi:hypothetical protein
MMMHGRQAARPDFSSAGLPRLPSALKPERRPGRSEDQSNAVWGIIDDGRSALGRLGASPGNLRTANGKTPPNILCDVNGLSRQAIGALSAAVYMTDADGHCLRSVSILYQSSRCAALGAFLQLASEPHPAPVYV